MLPTETDSGYTTSTRDPHQAVARSEAQASIRLQRDRATMYRGLCTNCEKLENCSYPSTITDTWYCEEYSVAKAPKLAVITDVNHEEPDTSMGLCANCALRETCKLPKAPGGVWFCNEYE